MPGLAPALSLLEPKSSRKRVGTEAEGTAQPQGWVMDLDPTACSEPALLSPRLEHFLLQLPLPSPQTQVNRTGTPREQSDIAGAARAPGRTDCPLPFPIAIPTHPRNLWDTAPQPRNQTWSGATTHLPSGFWGSHRRVLWRQAPRGAGHRGDNINTSPTALVPRAHTHPRSRWASPQQRGCHSRCTGGR